MKIDDTPLFPSLPQAGNTAKAGAGSGSFAEMMAASSPMDETAPSREPKSDMEIIREKGFSAYAEEVEKRKMAELREKILQRMGLSEEDLDRMPAEQRAQVEDLIAQEIQRRMQGNAELNDDDGGPSSLDAGAARTVAGPAGSGGAGSALLAVMEVRDSLTEKAETRPLLPGDQE